MTSTDDLELERTRAEFRRALADYKTRFANASAPAGLLDGIAALEQAVAGDSRTPAAEHGLEHDQYCRDLLSALNRARAVYESRAVSHSAGGLGEETISELDLDARNQHPQLLADIARLERAMMEAGCPI